MHLIKYYILVLVVLTSCVDRQNKEAMATQQADHVPTAVPDIPVKTEHCCGIKMSTTGPRGGGFTDYTGATIGYRVFRVEVFNDTVVPMTLEMLFPSEPVALLPDSTVRLGAYLLPDAITPDTIRDTYNFGVVGIEEFFKAATRKPSTLKTSIPPKENKVLYLGIVLHGEIDRGVARAKLFVNGRDTDSSFLPVTSIKTENTNSKSLELIFGIGIDPPEHYILMPVGHILFTY